MSKKKQLGNLVKGNHIIVQTNVYNIKVEDHSTQKIQVHYPSNVNLHGYPSKTQFPVFSYPR